MSRLLRVAAREQCIGCYSCMYSCSRTWFKALTVEKAAMRVKNYVGVEGAFSIRICYGCFQPDCAVACPTSALTPRKGGGIEFNQEECVHCGECVKGCLAGALQWDSETDHPIVCRQCGICVKFCPNQVLAMSEVSSEAEGGKK